MASSTLRRTLAVLLRGELDLGISRTKAGKLKTVGQGQKPLTDLEMELNRVKRELAEVKMERDLLKKFAAYFAKESR